MVYWTDRIAVGIYSGCMAVILLPVRDCVMFAYDAAQYK